MTITLLFFSKKLLSFDFFSSTPVLKKNFMLLISLLRIASKYFKILSVTLEIIINLLSSNNDFVNSPSTMSS